MTFQANVEMVNRVAKITLAGEIDAAAAAELQSCLEDAIDQGAERLALLMQDVRYLTSAGVRVLVYVAHKMGSTFGLDGDIYLVGANKYVRDFLAVMRFQDFFIFLNEYDAALIEKF